MPGIAGQISATRGRRVDYLTATVELFIIQEELEAEHGTYPLKPPNRIWWGFLCPAWACLPAAMGGSWVDRWTGRVELFIFLVVPKADLAAHTGKFSSSKTPVGGGRFFGLHQDAA